MGLVNDECLVHWQSSWVARSDDAEHRVVGDDQVSLVSCPPSEFGEALVDEGAPSAEAFTFGDGYLPPRPRAHPDGEVIAVSRGALLSERSQAQDFLPK